MKRTINIKFEVDATEYVDTEDTTLGTLELVKAMFDNDADFPEELSISCETVKMTVSQGVVTIHPVR